jgi:hypothetical protein
MSLSFFDVTPRRIPPGRQARDAQTASHRHEGPRSSTKALASLPQWKAVRSGRTHSAENGCGRDSDPASDGSASTAHCLCPCCYRNRSSEPSPSMGTRRMPSPITPPTGVSSSPHPLRSPAHRAGPRQGAGADHPAEDRPVHPPDHRPGSRAAARPPRRNRRRGVLTVTRTQPDRAHHSDRGCAEAGGPGRSQSPRAAGRIVTEAWPGCSSLGLDRLRVADAYGD